MILATRPRSAPTYRGDLGTGLTGACCCGNLPKSSKAQSLTQWGERYGPLLAGKEGAIASWSNLFRILVLRV